VAQSDLLFLRDDQSWKPFATIKAGVKGTYNRRELLLSEFVLPSLQSLRLEPLISLEQRVSKEFAMTLQRPRTISPVSQN
jgi:hypothetical protein